ncbi:MAG: hypothetical protein JWM14_3353 [Chitinophagaceae bacterium]|nr:hypothetical protein [Chitinophagaceae bacterium]
MLQKYKWTIRFTLLTPILLVLAFYFMNDGHDDFQPTFFLFPFVTILFFVWHHPINFIFLLLVFLQYPSYGLILDKYKNRFPYIGFIILLLHLLLVLVSYSLSPEIVK